MYRTVYRTECRDAFSSSTLIQLSYVPEHDVISAVLSELANIRTPAALLGGAALGTIFVGPNKTANKRLHLLYTALSTTAFALQLVCVLCSTVRSDNLMRRRGGQASPGISSQYFYLSYLDVSSTARRLFRSDFNLPMLVGCCGGNSSFDYGCSSGINGPMFCFTSIIKQRAGTRLHSSRGFALEETRLGKRKPESLLYTQIFRLYRATPTVHPMPPESTSSSRQNPTILFSLKYENNLVVHSYPTTAKPLKARDSVYFSGMFRLPQSLVFYQLR